MLPTFRSVRRTALAAVLVPIVTLALGCASNDAPSEKEEQLREARSRHRELLRAQRDSAATPPAPSAGAKLETGDRLLAGGDRPRAVMAYLEALKLEPDSVEPRLRIAFLHLEDDPSRAEAIFRGVTASHPDHVTAHLGLGLALLAQDQFEEAQRALGHAVALEPDSPEALSALGTVHDRLGEYGKAQPLHRRAHEIRPSDPRIANNLGVSYLLSRDAAAAEEAFRRAILLDPHDAALRNNLGLAFGLQGRYDDARKAFAATGSAQAVHNNLGYVYFLNGEHEHAIAEYEEALVAGGPATIAVLRNLTAARDALEAGPIPPEPSGAAPEPEAHGLLHSEEPAAEPPASPEP
jgi:Flp pilus assembly protein TadD